MILKEVLLVIFIITANVVCTHPSSEGQSAHNGTTQIEVSRIKDDLAAIDFYFFNQALSQDTKKAVAKFIKCFCQHWQSNAQSTDWLLKFLSSSQHRCSLPKLYELWKKNGKLSDGRNGMKKHKHQFQFKRHIQPRKWWIQQPKLFYHYWHLVKIDRYIEIFPNGFIDILTLYLDDVETG